MKKITVFSMVLLLMGMVAAANASYWLVSDIDTFNFYNQLYSGTDAIVENFNNNKINNPDITITAFGVDQGVLQLGYYQNVVDDATNSYQVVGYAKGMHGFGGWFDLAGPGGPGSSIDVFISGYGVVGTIPSSYAGQFWGVFSDTVFTSVTLQDAMLISGAQETYQMVDMAICPQVPIPPSAFLLGSGLLGVGLLRFRRKNAA
jgi:hypothetical protein